MIETSDWVLSRITPMMPLIRQDIRLATIVMSTFSRITPNLFTALDGIVAASRTMIDREKEFQAVLAGLSDAGRSEEHTSELQSLMRISYAVFCLKKKKKQAH